MTQFIKVTSLLYEVISLTSGMTDGPKECRDVTELTEGIIILSAVTHCYLFTSLTEN